MLPELPGVEPLRENIPGKTLIFFSILEGIPKVHRLILPSVVQPWLCWLTGKAGAAPLCALAQKPPNTVGGNGNCPSFVANTLLDGWFRDSEVVVVTFWPGQALLHEILVGSCGSALPSLGWLPAGVCTSGGDVLTFLISGWCCKDGVM